VSKRSEIVLSKEAACIPEKKRKTALAIVKDRSPLRISRPAHHTERPSVQPVVRSGDLATTTFPFARTDLAGLIFLGTIEI